MIEFSLLDIIGFIVTIIIVLAFTTRILTKIFFKTKYEEKEKYDGTKRNGKEKRSIKK